MKKTADIYIIAGQSNAAGYTSIDKSVLDNLWKDCYVGADTVLYAGRAEHTLNGGTPQVATGVNEIAWQNARAGQGKRSNYIGPELGMAKVLSERYYNASKPDKIAGIIKMAHGGTSLLNKTGGENAASGNWVSPSYASLKGLDWAGLTGGLYRLLTAQLEKNIGELEAEGYEICIKGMFWMQGESDRETPAEYKEAFKCFAKDIRADISKLMGEDLSAMPIMVGEISRSMGGSDTTNLNVNADFVEMQRSLSREIPNVYIIASTQLDVTTWDPITKQSLPDPHQKDTAHWNTERMFTLGKLVGECIVEKILGE